MMVYLKKMIMIFICSVLWFVGGCTSQISGVLLPQQQITSQQQFVVGVAKVDITPMPGIAMGGYSIVGTTGRGYWTRLYARSVYLQDTKGQSLVFVSCDLWAVSGGLADRVAELVSEQGKNISREQIILSATHTHHSPGNFSTSPMYNEFASYRKGFDTGLFSFLAKRIASSILEAIDNKQPATISYKIQKVAHVVRNRSLEAFLLNVESSEIIEENAPLPVEKVLNFTKDDYHAVDPKLHLLHFQSLTSPPKTIGAAAFFAVHPTVMGAKTEVYHADLYGIAVTKAEEYLKKHGALKPVVALFNGAEGDISPNWKKRDRVNTLYLGNILASQIIHTLKKTGKELKVDIEYNFENIDLEKRCFELKNIERCTADKPSVGVATVGGATDGRSRLHSFLWREQVKSTRDKSQGTKQPPNNPLRMELPFLARAVLDSLMGQIVPPHKCPLGVYKIGQLTFATMPGEFTTTLGRRIRHSLKDQLQTDVITIGLANEYISYFTTPEEYEIQYYEGASTLYGPFSGTFINKELLRLAREMGTKIPRQQPKSYSYDPGEYRKFSLEDIGSEPYLMDDGLSNLVQDVKSGKPVRNYPQFVWNDILPLWEGRVTPQVHLQIKKNNIWQDFVREGIVENDQGINFVTMALSTFEESSKWGCIWMSAESVEFPLRFCVKKLSGDIIYSPEFKGE